MIPKIIHQIWSETERPLPDKFVTLGKTWRYDYPDWKYEFWDDKRISKFVKQYFPQYWETYNLFPYNTQRLDVAIYLILLKIGGGYVDFAYESIHPLDGLLQGKTCCFSMEPNHYMRMGENRIFFNKALMFSRKNHPFINLIIEKIFLEEKVNKHYDNEMDTILKTTGAFVINQIYNSLEEKQKSEIYLIPAKYVSPFDYIQYGLIKEGVVNENFERCLKSAYALYHFHGTGMPETKKI